MKTKLSIFLTAIVGGLISTMPAQAASMFGNDGIMFEKDTTVQFDFLQSNGWWRADFGVLNIDTGVETILLQEDLNVDPGSGEANDSLGTSGIGKAVSNSQYNFTFAANNNYSFFLTSYNKDGVAETPYNTQYSTTDMNDSFYTNGTGTGANGDGTFTISDNDFDAGLNGQIIDGRVRALFEPSEGDSVNILFEDNTTWDDNDFDDFVVKAQIVESTPEPATLAGLGMVAGGMFLSRRKKQK